MTQNLESEKYQLKIEHAARIIEQADCLIIAAGAGMGVDSGLPDFRGNEGFWKAYPALRQSRLEFTSIASPRSFRTSPQLAWGFYGHRLALYRNTIPHAGFQTLKRWVQNLKLEHTIFTSNVDGQFQRAGFPNHKIVECHGSIHRLQCIENCSNQSWSADEFAPEIDQDKCLLTNQIPTCPTCGALARPNILMFNDDTWLERDTEQQITMQEILLRKFQRPVVIEMGAGNHISTVRNFSNRIIRNRGGRLIRINPQDYKVATPLDVGLPMGALAGLLAIDAELNKRS